MTYIKWQEEPFTVDVFGQELSFFYYGNYGGPDYPDKQELVTAKKHQPLSAEELALTDAPQPVSSIDYYFYVHDVESNSGNGYNKHQIEADLHLLTSLTEYTSGDPEESLYDGVASIAMIFQLFTHNQADSQTIPLLIDAVHKAVDDIETGLLGLANNPDPFAQAELAALLGVVFGLPTLGVYELEFTFPNMGLPEIQQEFLEGTVVNAIGDAINEVGEPAYMPPFAGGTDDYVLRLTGLDLDIVPMLLA
jgi:hypothetical protein